MSNLLQLKLKKKININSPDSPPSQPVESPPSQLVRSPPSKATSAPQKSSTTLVIRKKKGSQLEIAEDAPKARSLKVIRKGQPKEPKQKFNIQLESEDEEEELTVTRDDDELNFTSKKISLRKTPSSKETSLDDLPDLDNEEGIAMIADCFKSLHTRDPNSKLSTEDLIEECETKREALIKTQSKYSAADYQKKLGEMDQALSKLKVGFIKNNAREWKQFTATIKDIIRKKKMPKDQFKKKTDLTGERDNNDPTYHLLEASRKYFKKMGYEAVPQKLSKIDPSREENRKKGFGNAPMPANILSRLNSLDSHDLTNFKG